MKVGYWLGVVGVGVAFGSGLGGCGGFSDIGEGVPKSDAGEAGADPGTGGSTSTGGSKTTGGSTSVGGGMAVGGSNAMSVGGSVSVGGGMAVGGSNAMSVGGSMSVGGGMAVGGSNGMSVGGGMAVGGTTGTEEPPRCYVADDCPQPPPVCSMCADGSYSCAQVFCSYPTDVDPVPPMPDDAKMALGYCQYERDQCAPSDCSGQNCGAPCSIPDSMVANATCDGEGTCIAGGAQCEETPPPTECMTSADCGVVLDICQLCGDADGSSGNASCVSLACLGGQCESVCPLGPTCESDADCSGETERYCTTGPWLCVNQLCTLGISGCGAGPL